MTTLNMRQLKLPAAKPGRDRTALWVALVAACLSIAAYITTAMHNAVLAYGDAVSHLEIARRVLFGTSPGFAQLGGVWPPLPHTLTALLAWNDQLYYSGFAGSIVSMAAYVLTVVLVYKIVWRLSGSKFAGVTGATVLALSANMLYMQSLPMTEALLLCMLAATVYNAQQWIDTDESKYLVRTGLSALLATLTRYESWPFVCFLLLAMTVVAWRRAMPHAEWFASGVVKKLHRARARDRVIYVALPTLAGIVGWMLWNQVIFGSAFSFQTGDYAKPSLWLSGNEPAIGNWWIAAKTYAYAVAENLSLPVVTLAVAGLGCLIVFEIYRKHSLYRTLPVLTLLTIMPFYIVALYQGQRPLHVAQITGDLYNVRFGLVLLLPAAILIGYLVGSLKNVLPYAQYVVGGAVIVAVALTNATLVADRDIATFREAEGSTSPFQLQVAASLEQQYDGGLVLMETFGNERLAFRAIPANQLVYEGSYRQWKPSLRSPSANNITWIVARCGPSADEVCKTVNAGEFARYDLVDRMVDPSNGNIYSFYRRSSS